MASSSRRTRPRPSAHHDQRQVPTLVMMGDGDVPDILENADRIVAGSTLGRKAVIHDAAHMVNMERSQEFNRLVLDFLGARQS